MDNTTNDEGFPQEAYDEACSSCEATEKVDYDDKFILKSLLCGKTREEIASELNHKSYRTLDMYMRRRGYVWNSERQIYVKKNTDDLKITVEDETPTTKVQRIITLFNSGLEPMEVAKKVGMKDHRTMAMYMKSKGYIWSSEKKNYTLEKGLVKEEPKLSENTNITDKKDMTDKNENLDVFGQFERFVKLIPMLEMIEKNYDKIAERLSINSSNTIPRYIVGGVTITKSICMSYPLAELVKEFSIEKNISQREIFEVAIIEFLRKYGFENEINSLFEKQNK
ncbi:MAG TPA: hypothetical protein DEF85_10220 [Clostridiaceae bacterium]|jgi:hypothetical protein|nr:hypothetical protein [Clostridiaceae bacterium]